MTDIQPTTAPPPPRGRKSGNPVRFPSVLNAAVSTEIAEGLERARLSFHGLGYTPSDITRLALFEWLAAKGYLAAPTNGKEVQS